jgi:hypothetical protein
VNSSSTILSRTSAKERSGLLVLVCPKYFKKCRDKIRCILARCNSTWSVDKLIKRYNTSLHVIMNCFGITRTTRTQLRYIDSLGYRWFRRLLLQKFSSTPSLHTNITKSYYTDDWRLKHNEKTQVKTGDLKPCNNTRRSYKVLNSNIYLNQLKHNNNITTTCQTFLKITDQTLKNTNSQDY